MKAILKYGQFTSMIELPRLLPRISIIKPMEALSFMPLPEPDITLNATRLLHFRHHKRIEEDLHVYEFESEG